MDTKGKATVKKEGLSLKIIRFGDICAEHVLCHICGVLQKWEPGANWNFIGAPRPKQGFMYICSGTVTVEYKGGEVEHYKKGNLLYIPKGCEYRIRFEKSDKNCSDLLVNFVLRDTSREECCFAEKIVCLLENASARVVEDLQYICENSKSMRSAYLKNTSKFCNFLDCLSDYEEWDKLTAAANRNIAPALFYLNKHIESDASVAALAKMCCMCETSFRRAFKEHTGMSPTQYRIHAKIEKAKALLASSPEISITEVANILGFFDAPYFCKTFTSIVGVPPTQYKSEL